MKSGLRAPNKQRKQKAKRVNITMPEGLYNEALALCKKYHFEGPSDLIQELIRREAFPSQGKNIQLNEGAPNEEQ